VARVRGRSALDKRASPDAHPAVSEYRVVVGPGGT
jgi:hypothetical protein